MCGLGGYIGKPVKDESVLWRLFDELRARGTDGYGFMSYHPNEQPGRRVLVYKDATAVNIKALTSGPGVAGATAVIMHTRAATSGSKEAVDCHPLVHNSIVVAHNGVINNYKEIKKELGLEDPEKYPQVDSFLIAYIIGEAKSIRAGIEEVWKKLTGSITFLAFSPKAPMTIFAASNVTNNLFQFKFKGNDYLCSTTDYFETAITKPNRWNGKYHPEWNESGYLEGVWELSPHTMKSMLTYQDIVKMRPAYTAPVTGYVGKGYGGLKRIGKTQTTTRVSPPGRGGLYLLAGDIPTTETKLAEPLGLTAEDKERVVPWVRGGMQAENLVMEDVRKILQYVKSNECELIREEPLKSACVLCLGNRARAIYDSVKVCFRCMLIQAQIPTVKAEEKTIIIDVHNMGEDNATNIPVYKTTSIDEKKAVREALEGLDRFGPVGE